MAVGALVALSAPQETDTTFTVTPGQRLNVATFGGEIVIRTWELDQVRIEADHSSREHLVIEQNASEVRVRPSSWNSDFEFNVEGDEFDVSMNFRGGRAPAMVDYEIVVPEGMALEIGGLFTDVEIEGAVGEITVRVLEGEIDVTGARGLVSARTGEGDIDLVDVVGAMRLSTIGGEITVENASGDITAQSTEGDIDLEMVQASRVEAESVDGEIWYQGTIEAQGFYSFVTHNGDVTLEIAPAASARVSVATWDGDLSTDFEVEVPERIRGRRFSFTLGSGSAQIEIEAFDGDIDVRYWEPDTDEQDQEMEIEF
jgi:hypothetical protein